MAHGPAYPCPVFVICRGAGRHTLGPEGIEGEVTVVHGPLDIAEACAAVFSLQPDEGHLAAVVTEDDDIAEERIEHVRGVILRLAAVGDVDRLEMADGIVGRVAIEAAVASIVPGDIEPADKAAQGILGGELAVERLLLAGPVGEDIGCHAVADTDGSDGVEADEGAVVLRAVVVGAFEQDALREEVPDLEVSLHGRVQVARDGCMDGVECVCLHDAD